MNAIEGEQRLCSGMVDMQRKRERERIKMGN
jgi:hypothetical protein